VRGVVTFELEQMQSAESCSRWYRPCKTRRRRGLFPNSLLDFLSQSRELRQADRRQTAHKRR